MKVLSFALALTALALSTPVDAQILGTRLPSPTTSSGGSIDGSWRVVGRDGNGNAIYERSTRDRNGNIVVQRAVRDGNGNMRIVSSRTERDNRGNRDNRNCDYNRSTNTIGDIIFGRTNDTYCDDVGSRIDGGWYQVGHGRGNNSEYVRRTRDASGNLVIQRARRDRNGNFRIISTRYATDNDKEWKKANKDYDKAVKRSDKDYRKDSKRYDKKGHDDNNRYDVYNRGDDRYYVGSNAVARGNGKGKDTKHKH